MNPIVDQLLLPESAMTSAPAHDIFLSHSGKQKGFVLDLYQRLSSSYRVFLDVTDHSLPPAEQFPPLIFAAAGNCKLAVVVLSPDFVVSYWPMLELCAFMRAVPSLKILPLFYLLSPSDLKREDNLETWRKAWHTHAANQSINSNHAPIDVLEWEHALKCLRSLNGIIANPSIEGEHAYLDKIVFKISKIVPPAVKYDISGTHGMERLCQIIVAEFANLERRTLQPARNNQSASLQYSSRVHILAMFGLPGSGKSTLCKYLCNHYFPYVDGKAIYIELPTNPTNEQLAKKFKEFLDRLTNFNNMVDLTHASDLEQIYYALRNSSLLRYSPIFLVLDNISENTLEVVRRILKFGVGPGSKVMLVARTLDVLQSCLDPQMEQSCYMSTSINVPSLNEKEAMRVMLQSRDNWDLPDHDFTPDDRQIMEEVVRMSGFGPEHRRIYLPLVMKIMGQQLRRHKLDVKQWGSAMRSFWRTAEKCKERTLLELVQESFLQLSNRLQLLFLDLALLISVLPEIGHVRLEEKACNILSIMHDCSPEDIIMDMHDLQSHCFVEDFEPVRIHDVFLEFAASIPESTMYYAVSCRCRIQRKNRDDMLQTELPPPPTRAREMELRAVVLELSEEHKRFDFWPGFSNVKALILRNCKQLAVLGLKGLTSLVILDIDNCPSLKAFDLPARGADHRNLLDSVRWFGWIDAQCENNMVMEDRKSNNMVQIYAKQGKQIVNKAWSRLSGMLGASLERPFRMEIGGFAFQMRGLQALDLKNTGIKHLGDLSMCWPQLKELTITEKSLEHVEVGMLPYLKRFAFYCDNGTEFYTTFLVRESRSTGHSKPKEPVLFCKASPRVFRNTNFLVGCPALETVDIRFASFEDGLGTLVTPQLHSLELSNFWHAKELPNLGACAGSLRELRLSHCRDLRSADFMYRFERFTELYLLGCPILTIVSGLDCLPSLRILRIQHCENLQTLNGLSGLISLEKYQVGECCPNLEVSLSDLEGLTNIWKFEHHCNINAFRNGVFNVRKLVDLVRFKLQATSSSAFDTGANLFEGLECMERLSQLSLAVTCEEEEEEEEEDKEATWEEEEEEVTGETHCHTFLDFTTLLGVPEPSHLSHLTSLCVLRLDGVRNLASLRGIGFLHPLQMLCLQSLQNLSCLQGIEFLTNLEVLEVQDCASMEELPSLSQLLNLHTLFLENCMKLKSVDLGCSTRTVHLVRCKSMACFPLDYATVSRLYSLRVEGSKFASREVLVSWSSDYTKPAVVHRAVLEALMWELCSNLRGQPREQEQLARMLLDERAGAGAGAGAAGESCYCEKLLRLCEQVVQGDYL